MSQECLRDTTGCLAHAEETAGWTNSSWGGGLESEGHLQPPDRDLSRLPVLLPARI